MSFLFEVYVFGFFFFGIMAFIASVLVCVGSKYWSVFAICDPKRYDDKLTEIRSWINTSKHISGHGFTSFLLMLFCATVGFILGVTWPVTVPMQIRDVMRK